MASNWQEQYKKLKKRKELIDTLSGGGDLAPVKTTKSTVSNRNLYTNGAESTLQKKTTPVKTSTSKKKEEKGLFDAFDDGYDFGDVTKTILTGGKMVLDPVFKVGKGLITDPIQTIKTTTVGIGEGINKADEMVNNAVDDFFNFIVPGREERQKKSVSVGLLGLEKFSKTATDEEKAKLLKEYEEIYGKDDPIYHSAVEALTGQSEKKGGILSAKYYDTKTYKKAKTGELSEEQQEIYSAGENIGGMAYDLGIAWLTGGTAKGLGATAKTVKKVSEVVGKTSLFVRSQQAATEEAKAQGYDDDKARLYGLTVGGAEVVMESFGFDEYGALGKLTDGNIVKIAGGEAMEEFFMPYIEETARAGYFGEDFNFEETTEEALRGAGAGGMLGVIMSSGGRGYKKVDAVIEKANNGQEITDKDVIDAIQEIETDKPGTIQQIVNRSTTILKEDVQLEKNKEQEEIAPVQETETLQETPVEVNKQVGEQELKRQHYQYTPIETDSDFTRELKESASRVMNNTKRSHEFVETVSKIAEKTGTKYKFTNNEELAANNYKVEGKTVNGLVTENGEVLINIDSQKALNTIVGHETLHLVENEAEFAKLKDFAKQYAITKGDYDARLQRTYKLYEGVNANVENEVIADIIGDYLFTDQQFIDNLSVENPNFFQKIYNEIKHWYNMATAGSKEARQFEQLKYSFEKALNSKQNNTSAENVASKGAKTKYSIQTRENGSKYIKVDADQHIFDGVEPNDYKKIVKKYMNDYLRGQTELGSLNSNEMVNIGTKGIKKYTNPGKRQYNFNEKMKLAPELQNVLEIAEKTSEGTASKENSKFKNWEYYQVDFNVNGKDFSGKVNIGIDSNGNKHFYEINNIEQKNTRGISETSQNWHSGAFMTNNIPQNKKNVKFSLDDNEINTYSRDAYDGQVDMTKEITDDNGNVIAKLDYSLYEDTVNVQMIDVDSEHRRKGLATKLLQDLQKQYPDTEINFGMTTSDGTKLLEKITEKKENPKYNKEKAELIKQYEAEAKKYDDAYNELNDKLREYYKISQTRELTEVEKADRKRISLEQIEVMDLRSEANEKWYEADQNTTKEERKQYRAFVKTDNTKYSLTDNQDRELSKEQQEYFKDSKVRDENGSLATVYHGTPYGGFTEFDGSHMSSKDGSGYLGDGFYFTNSYEYAQDYTDEAFIDEYTRNNAKPGEYGNPQVYETYLNIKNPYIIKESDVEYDKNTLSNAVGTSTNAQATNRLKQQGYDGIIYEFKSGTKEYLAFDSNQIKNVDNTKPTSNPDIRYSLSEDTSFEDKVNSSMTMEEAKDMVQRIFVLNDLKNWYEDKYQNGDEWLAGEGIEEVEMYAENTELIQTKFLNKLNDKNNGYYDEYYLSDILTAYQNGTLTGEVKQDVGRIDVSKDTGYKDDRFYAPKDVTGGIEVYEKASQRVTNKNREEVYKARADFIINAHNKGYIESIGLTTEEVNKKLKVWADYPKRAMELSRSLNENVSKQNQWAGLENSSVVNTASISNEDMSKMVKEVKGDSNGWQRHYITSTMLALDTHIDYSPLTFDFEQGAALVKSRAAGDYNSETDVIRIGNGYQNTVAHEIGHYIDYSWGKQLFGRKDTLSSLVKSYDKSKFTTEQIQFIEHFNEFQESIERTGEQGDTLKYGSSRGGSYWQKPTEVFARFVGRFTEWVKNQASNNRYGYEEKHYKDNFTESQYREFVKILQEKSALDTTTAKKYNVFNQELIEAIDSITENQRQELADILNDKNIDNIPSYQVTEKIQEVIGKDAYYKIGRNMLEDLVNNNFYGEANTKYSLSQQDEQIAPVGDYNVYGEDVKVQQQVQDAIAPLQEQIETLTNTITNLQENIAPAPMDLVNEEGRRRLQQMTDEDAPLNEGVFNFNEDVTLKGKGKKNIINEIRNNFNIKQIEARDLYNKIAAAEYPTVDDVFNELQDYKTIKYEQENDYYKDIKNHIKGTRLNISNIKDQIADYSNTYRMSNMGKGLILGNSGQSVDTFYQELNELYPDVFPSDVTAEADQLDRISNFLYEDTTLTFAETISDEDLYELAQNILTDIGNNERYRGSLSHRYFQMERIKNGELIAPVETQEEYLKNLPDTLDDKYAPYLEMARQINAENSTGNNDVSNELNRFNINSQTSEKVAEKGLNEVNKPKAKATNKKSSALDTLNYLFVNRNVAVDKYSRETGNKNIKFLADHVNNVFGEVSTNINSSQTDNYGRTIGKSITDIFNQARDKGLSEAFNDYLFHRSNVARHQQSKGSQIPVLESDLLVKEYNEAYPQFKKWAAEVNQYNKNNLYKQVDAGLYTRELADKITNMYDFYVPFFEDVERIYADGYNREIGVKGTIKRAKGGADKNLLDFEQAMMKQTQSTITAIRKNQLYSEIVKTSSDKVDLGNGDGDVKSLYKDENGYFVTAFVDGKQQSARVSEELFRGLENRLEQQIKDYEARLGWVTKGLQTVGNIRRNMLTTWSPSFAITNPLKDIQDAPLNSKYATDWAKNYPKALKELTTGKGDHVQEFLNMYGKANLMGNYATDSGVFDITSAAKQSKKLSKFLQINEIMEMTPRYAEYLASLENGTSQMEALYNAREVTTNFGRGGVITKAVNRNGFTFLNASVQGFNKLYRNFSGENGAKGVANATLKAVMLGVVPALFNEMAFGGDDEDEDYKALPDYIKDNYYLIKTDDGEFIRIPKGRMLSIFGSAARRTLEFMQGEEDAFEGFISNAYSQVGIQNPMESNILAPILQAYGSENGETWYGTDIVPSRLQNVPKEEQYDESIDKFSIWLGEQTGLSPYKLNYVLDQYSGGIGDIVLPMITEEATSDAETIPEMILAPIKDKFTANSTTDNKYVSDVYNLSDELYKKSNSRNATEEDMLKNQYIYSITSEMGKLYAERREVQNDSNLTKSEKYERTQAIKDEINRLAEEGLNNYQNINKTDNYAIVGGREFNKYTAQDGTEKWGSVFEDELEEMNALGMELEEKSEYVGAKKTISEIQSNYDGSSDYAAKKRDIISVVKDTNLTDEQKAYLYDRYYASTDTLNTVTTLGIDFDEYLDYESQEFEADKDKKGNSISGSKKKKVFDYINSMDIDFEQKLVLAKLQYPSYDEYNYEIVDYLNKSDLSYEEEVALLKKMKFEVDDEGNVYW